MELNQYGNFLDRFGATGPGPDDKEKGKVSPGKETPKGPGPNIPGPKIPDPRIPDPNIPDPKIPDPKIPDPKTDETDKTNETDQIAVNTENTEENTENTSAAANELNKCYVVQKAASIYRGLVNRTGLTRSLADRLDNTGQDVCKLVVGTRAGKKADELVANVAVRARRATQNCFMCTKNGVESCKHSVPVRIGTAAFHFSFRYFPLLMLLRFWIDGMLFVSETSLALLHDLVRTVDRKYTISQSPETPREAHELPEIVEQPGNHQTPPNSPEKQSNTPKKAASSNSPPKAASSSPQKAASTSRPEQPDSSPKAVPSPKASPVPSAGQAETEGSPERRVMGAEGGEPAEEDNGSKEGTPGKAEKVNEPLEQEGVLEEEVEGGPADPEVDENEGTPVVHDSRTDSYFTRSFNATKKYFWQTLRFSAVVFLIPAATLVVLCLARISNEVHRLAGLPEFDSLEEHEQRKFIYKHLVNRPKDQQVRKLRKNEWLVDSVLDWWARELLKYPLTGKVFNVFGIKRPVKLAQDMAVWFNTRYYGQEEAEHAVYLRDDPDYDENQDPDYQPEEDERSEDSLEYKDDAELDGDVQE